MDNEELIEAIDQLRYAINNLTESIDDLRSNLPNTNRLADKLGEVIYEIKNVNMSINSQ